MKCQSLFCEVRAPGLKSAHFVGYIEALSVRKAPTVATTFALTPAKAAQTRSPGSHISAQNSVSAGGPCPNNGHLGIL